MGRRKSVLKIPKTASITCTACNQLSKRKIPLNASPQYFDCDKCAHRMMTPITSCCVICAYTGKKCVPSLKQEAYSKDLILK